MSTITIDRLVSADEENRKLAIAYNVATIKFGLELGKRLIVWEEKELYKKLDIDSYLSFKSYVESLGINYKSARQKIGLYKAYVLEAGYTIDELKDISYQKLTIVKPQLFRFNRKDNSYDLRVPKTEVKKWVAVAKSDLTQEDIMQKRREEEVGDHEHEMEEIRFKRCKLCGLREFY